LGWTIEFDPEAIRDLNKLDRSIKAQIFEYLTTRIAAAENPRDFGKPLLHEKFGLWRYRVRDYRVVCELQDQRRTVLVVAVGHRKDVYE
jgi:mRNA interferase RelE/StbE